MGVIEKIISKIGPIDNYYNEVDKWDLLSVIVSLMEDDQELVKEYLIHMGELHKFYYDCASVNLSKKTYMVLRLSSCINIHLTNNHSNYSDVYTGVCVEINNGDMKEGQVENNLYKLAFDKQYKYPNVFNEIVANSPNIFVINKHIMFKSNVVESQKYIQLANYYNKLVNNQIKKLNQFCIYSYSNNMRTYAKKVVLHTLDDYNKKFFLILAFTNFKNFYHLTYENDISMYKDTWSSNDITYNEKLHRAYTGIYFKLIINKNADCLKIVNMLRNTEWSDYLLDSIEIKDIMNFFAPSIQWDYFDIISSHKKNPEIEFDTHNAIKDKYLIIVQKNNMKLIYFINGPAPVAADMCAFFKRFSSIDCFNTVAIESGTECEWNLQSLSYFEDTFDISKVVFNCEPSGKGIEYYKQFGVNILIGEHNGNI